MIRFLGYFWSFLSSGAKSTYENQQFWFLSVTLDFFAWNHIDIDNIGCLEPFLPLWEHFWNRVSLQLKCTPDMTPRHSLTAWVWILYLSQWGTGFYPREWILLWETNSLPNGYPVKSFIPPFPNVYLISYTTGWHYKMFDILSDFSPIKYLNNEKFTETHFLPRQGYVTYTKQWDMCVQTS